MIPKLRLLFLLTLILVYRNIVIGQCPLYFNSDVSGNRIYRGNNCDQNCSLLVINKLDDGDGSLRRAIECAVDGDTISFAPNLFGDTIIVNSGSIVVNKGINILQTNSTSVNILSQHGESIFLFNVGSSTVRWINMFTFNNQERFGRALVNYTSLDLDNITIKEPTIVNEHGSTISNSGFLTINGNTKIIFTN